MKFRLLAILWMSCSLLSLGAQTRVDRFDIRAILEEVKPLHDFTGKMLPVHLIHDLC